MNGRTALHLALIASLTACAYPLTALLCVWDGKPVGLSAWGMAGLLALLLWLGLGGILAAAAISLLVMGTTKTLSGTSYLYPLVPFDWDVLKRLIFRTRR